MEASTTRAAGGGAFDERGVLSSFWPTGSSTLLLLFLEKLRNPPEGEEARGREKIWGRRFGGEEDGGLKQRWVLRELLKHTAAAAV